MFALLFFTAKSATSNDLLPPFYLTSRDTARTWQFGGSFDVQEDYIILAPPIQFRKGNAWSMLGAPLKNWSIYFHLNISEGTGGGGFGIWLIDNHGADGDFYGGPSSFRGVSLIGAVFGNILKFKLIETDYDKMYYMFNSSNDTDFDFDYDISNESIIICFEVYKLENKESLINISYLDTNFEPVLMISKKISVSLYKTWLGISAMNNKWTSKFTLLAARFSIYDYFAALQHGVEKPYHFYNPLYGSKTNANYKTNELRNPYFKFVKKEISSFKQNNGTIGNQIAKTSDDIFTMIDEINNVFNDIAHYKTLNHVLSRIVVPYAEKWQKRIFKIIEISNNATFLFSDMFNKTQTLLYIFDQTLNDTNRKTSFKLSDLNVKILGEAKQTEKEYQDLIQEGSPILFSILKYVTIAEIILLLLFYVYIIKLSRKAEYL